MPFSTIIESMFSKVILSLLVVFSFTNKVKANETIVQYDLTQKESKKIESGLKQALIPIGYLQQRSFTNQVDINGRVKLGGGFVDFSLPTLSSQDYKVTYSQQIVSYVNQSFQKIYILHQVFRI